jgi:hypothetical protein
VKDRCFGISCAEGEYCASGKCVALNCGVGCPASQICIAGQCRINKCTTVACDSLEYCEHATGTCKPNMCIAKTCPHCAAATGECTPDPCANIGCPKDGCWTCQVTPQGEPYCAFGSNCGYVKTFAGNTGGGCACSVSDGSTSGLAGSAGLLMSLLFGLTLFARGRRR